MAFWDFFTKKEKIQNEAKVIKPKNSWAVLGPAYLDGLTTQTSQNELKPFEWEGQLKSLSGETKFKIKFYGQLNKKLIVGTDFSPALIFAYSTSTKEKILLFDGCKHGYNPIFCDTFTAEQLGRTTDHFYVDKDGNDTFEIVISAYYQIDYEDEKEDFIENVDENGLIELNDGSKVDFDTVKRNGFDFLQISLITSKGTSIEILSEELA
ncbi:MAG: hypothetical protein U0V72_05295 [Cytophagales bacterium]